jgi:endonuclease III
MSKQIENSKRLRYIRILERFKSSIIVYLSKTDDLLKEVYNKRIENNLRYYNKVEAIQLYKGEYSDLEALVQKMIAYQTKDTDIEEIKEALLYDANQLEKSVNNRRYKKDKHKNSKFDEWS